MPGDVVRGQHVLRVPASVESGAYELWLSVAGDAASRALLAKVRITAPTRYYESPAVSHFVNVTLGDVGTLVGYDVSRARLAAGETVEVDLVWRALATPGVSYHVFVHLVDSRGQLVAQSDGVPSGWTRPTTGWLASEYIRDLHSVEVPAGALAGRYQLRTGLYLPGNGRLESTDGADSILLTEITVAE
jgi:hypothetical protein